MSDIVTKLRRQADDWERDGFGCPHTAERRKHAAQLRALADLVEAGRKQRDAECRQDLDVGVAAMMNALTRLDGEVR